MTTYCSLVSIEYHCHYSSNDISEPEKLKLRAMLALRHIAGLGLLLAHLTDPLNPRNRNDLSLREAHACEDEFEEGLHALGRIIAAIAGGAIGDLDEFDFKEHTA